MKAGLARARAKGKTLGRPKADAEIEGASGILPRRESA